MVNISGTDFRKHLEKTTLKEQIKICKNIYIQNLITYFNKIYELAIISTIGPATEKEKNLKLILKKSNILRINGSHNTVYGMKKSATK